VNFIYPILDSKWVSPLVVVSKKNGKWRICVDYRELKKATQKDHFPLPFIDQVLDTLAGKKLFSFLDGFSGYNQIQSPPKTKTKLPLPTHGVCFLTECYHLAYAIPPLHFKGPYSVFLLI